MLGFCLTVRTGVPGHNRISNLWSAGTWVCKPTVRKRSQVLFPAASAESGGGLLVIERESPMDIVAPSAIVMSTGSALRQHSATKTGLQARARAKNAGR